MNEARTKLLNFLRSSLNGQLDFGDFPHLKVPIQSFVRVFPSREPYQIRCLRILLRRLFQPPMSGPYPPIALINERKDVPLIFFLKTDETGIIRILLLRFEVFLL
jgi:hypothetical protein